MKFIVNLLFISLILVGNAVAQTPDYSGLGNVSCPSLSRYLKYNFTDANTGGEVSQLQHFLINYFKLNKTELSVTGFFDKVSKGHVMNFQRENGLIVTGLVGRPTRNKILSKCKVVPVSTPEPVQPLSECCGVAQETLAIPNPMTGFWMVGNQLVAGDYIAETASMSNVAVFYPDENSKFLPRVIKASSNGLKSVLMLQRSLFQTDNGVPFADYKSRFDTIWNELSGYENKIVGFYLIDEPYGQNVVNTIPETQLKANLNQVAAYIKQKAPGRPLLMTEMHPIVSRNDFTTLIPENVDYIGFNCYLSFGEACSEVNIKRLVEKLVSSKLPNQKIIVTADGYWPTNSTEAEDDSLRSRVVFWENLLKPYFSSGTVGAFLPFIYQTVPAAGNVFGVVESPKTLQEVSRYMRSVKSGTPTPLTNLALNKYATASSTYLNYVPNNVTDGNPNTYWLASGYSKQWISIDLGSTKTIGEVHLMIGQSPNGQTTHKVYGSNTGIEGGWQELKVFQGNTVDAQRLQFSLSSSANNFRYIRVETTESPSWVAWKEIEIYGF